MGAIIHTHHIGDGTSSDSQRHSTDKATEETEAGKHTQARALRADDSEYNEQDVADVVKVDAAVDFAKWCKQQRPKRKAKNEDRHDKGCQLGVGVLELYHDFWYSWCKHGAGKGNNETLDADERNIDYLLACLPVSGVCRVIGPIPTD